MDVGQAVGIDGSEELLGLGDFHRAVPEGQITGQARIVPIGHSGRDHAPGAGQFAVVVVVGGFLHWATLITTALKRAIRAVDAVVQTIGALHAVRDGDFADGAAVGLKQRYGSVGGLIGARLRHIEHLHLSKAYLHLLCG